MADQKINGTQESYEKILRTSLRKRMTQYLNGLPQGELTGNDKTLILSYLDSIKTKGHNWGIIYQHPIEIITQHLVDGELRKLENESLTRYKKKLTYQEIEKMNL
jgi:hypothetical protein